MNIGIRLHDAAGDTLVKKMNNVKAQGFQCVHLALSKVMGSEYALPEHLTPELASQVRDSVKPLDIAVLGSYFNLAHPDEHEAHAIQSQYLAHLRFSKWSGAALVGTETGNPNAEYRYDPEHSHSDESLALFIERLSPVVKTAQSLDAVIAIEPVWSHIVYSAERARQVLDHFRSPHLKIILDPVNLLHEDNLSSHESVFEEAFDLLSEDTAVLHIKDCVAEGGLIRSVAAGKGIINYRPLFARMRQMSVIPPITLEDTLPGNAEEALRYVRHLVEG